MKVREAMATTISTARPNEMVARAADLMLGITHGAQWCDIEIAVVSPRLRASRCGVLGIANMPDIRDDLRPPPRSLSRTDTGTPF